MKNLQEKFMRKESVPSMSHTIKKLELFMISITSLYTIILQSRDLALFIFLYYILYVIYYYNFIYYILL